MENGYDPEEYLSKTGPPSPVLGRGGDFVAEVSDIASVGIFGGSVSSGVVFTVDQMRVLNKWFPIEGDEPQNLLVDAINERNLFRAVHQHGTRLMAFLAGRNLLEENRDPVLSLADMLGDYLQEEVVSLTTGEPDE